MTCFTLFEKKEYLLGIKTKIYHGTLYFKGKNLIKEDRMIYSARYCFENTVDFEYDSKKILLCYFRI
jgi:hypothetical protein